MAKETDKHKALEVLQSYWGYEDFRSGQWDIIERVIDGKDVLAILPTGGGKSLCYQVPAMLREGVTLVVSPLIALMEDQVQRLEKSGIRATFINSTLTARQIDQRWTDIEFGRYKLVYLAPERLQNEMFLARVARLNIELLAVDEAHCVSEWGFDFRPAYLKIADVRPLLPDVPLVALTATATPPVRDDILRYLALKMPYVHVKGFDRPNIRWSIFQTENKRKSVQDVLKGVPGSGVIYAATRRRVETWQQWLEAEGHEASAYHGGMAHHIRKKAAEEWLSGQTRIMVATNAFGMGIDKPDVRFVIHADLPGALEAYYQEAGRAGRDGGRAYAVLLYQEADEDTQRELIDESHPDRKDLQAIYDAACAQGGIAMGDLPDQPITLSVSRIAVQVGISPIKVKAGVELLVRADIWSYLPVKRNRVHIKYRQTPANVRRYASELKNEDLATFIEVLMRTVHGDAFADWWEVDLHLLEKRTQKSRDDLFEYLAFLESREIMYWMAPDSQLNIVFQEARSKTIPLEQYHSRKAKNRALRRLDDMIRYARSVSCRRQFLLKYFGESSKDRCGACDICLGRHEAVFVTPADEPILRKILDRIQNGALLNVDAIEEINTSRQLTGYLRWLVQEEYLVSTDALEGKFRITDKAARFLEEWKPT